MTPRERANEKNHRIQQAMLPLVNDGRFVAFIDEVREQMDTATEDAVTDRVLANERMLSVALGEIRAYKGIISVYENFKQQAEVSEDQEVAVD